MISMAESATVKKYLAYWFQLGKKMILPNQGITLLPSKIYSHHGGDYSQEFEDCWNLINQKENQDCYLEGTSQTIQQLLSSKWEITDCARCSMPVPMIDIGFQASGCMCGDMDNWPNNELPTPRNPVNNQSKLKKISESLKEKSASLEA